MGRTPRAAFWHCPEHAQSNPDPLCRSELGAGGRRCYLVQFAKDGGEKEERDGELLKDASLSPCQRSLTRRRNMPSLAQEPPGTSVSKVHPSAFSQQPREGGGTGAKGSDWGRGQGAARKEPGRRSLVPVPEIVSLKSKKKKRGWWRCAYSAEWCCRSSAGVFKKSF